MKTSGESHLSVSRLSKSYRAGGERIHVIDDVDLDIARGEFISLLGPSGCGKTTLLRLIGGLIEPDAGDVDIDGRPPRLAQADREFAFVFQEPALLPWRSVAANVRLPLDAGGADGQGSADRVEDLLKIVGLERFADYYPHQLSGGMSQRAALARALAVGASVLLMDEPFGALDEITRASMRYELLRIWEADKKTVVFVTHSIAEALALSDRVVVLSRLPARVVDVVDVGLPRPRSRRVEREPEFLQRSEILHDLLEQHSGAHPDVAQPAAPASRPRELT